MLQNKAKKLLLSSSIEVAMWRFIYHSKMYTLVNVLYRPNDMYRSFSTKFITIRSPWALENCPGISTACTIKLFTAAMYGFS